MRLTLLYFVTLQLTVAMLKESMDITLNKFSEMAEQYKNICNLLNAKSKACSQLLFCDYICQIIFIKGCLQVMTISLKNDMMNFLNCKSFCLLLLEPLEEELYSPDTPAYRKVALKTMVQHIDQKLRDVRKKTTTAQIISHT